MTKSESRYFNTARRMDDALLSLLESKDYQYITVTDICKKARVHRSTFYLHYDGVSDLLTETLEHLLSQLSEKFNHLDIVNESKIARCPAEELILITPEYLIPYLEFVRAHRNVYRVAVTQPAVLQANRMFTQYYEHIFRPIMERFGLSEREMQYRLRFYLSGMFALISEWIQNDCKEEIPVIANLLIACVFPLRS